MYYYAKSNYNLLNIKDKYIDDADYNTKQHKENLEKWLIGLQIAIYVIAFFTTILFFFIYDYYASNKLILSMFIISGIFGLCSYFVIRDIGLFENPVTSNLFMSQLSFYVIYYMTYYIFFKNPKNVKLYKHFKTTLIKI